MIGFDNAVSTRNHRHVGGGYGIHEQRKRDRTDYFKALVDRIWNE